MKLNNYIKCIVMLSTILLLSCEDYLEVDAPNNQLVLEKVFSNEATATSAMQGIYNQLFQASFANGSVYSISVLAGLSADNLKNISNNAGRMEFEENEIMPANENNLYIWSSAYNIIYMTNSFLQGLDGSNELNSDLKLQLEGEARFVRAFTYFYLVNLYGNVPLILSTNYSENQLASRAPTADVYAQISEDLEVATNLLSTEYREADRSHVNKYAALALLARVNLYTQNWQKADDLSTQVINEQSFYEIIEDLDKVFLANSQEAIWQISPIGGGGTVTNTNEGNLFIIDPFFSFFASLKLNQELINSYTDNDKRLMNWVDYNEEKDAYFPVKYKIDYSTSFPIKEYSMVLRLAEQYLIRAEARARQDNLSGAIADLDIIRTRAGLSPIQETQPNISQAMLLDLIMEERRKELFTEWGHRWLDLKRTEKASIVLGNKPYWEPTDVLYPIPSVERMKDSNLSQNDGY